MKRVLAFAGVFVLLLVATGALLLFVITGTDYGREAARKVALNALGGSVHGHVSIGRIEGNLLGRFTLVDVSITDSAGAPFIAADRVGVALDANALWSKRIVLSSVSLNRPVIHLSRRPDQPWNVARIFPSSEPSTDTMPGFGSWITLRDVTITDGVLVVQQPYATDDKLPPAAKDSVVAALLAGRERARVDRADYGLRQTMDFTDIDARISDFVVANTDSAGMSLRLDTLSMVAAPFHAPTFALRQLAGAVHIGDDSVTLHRMVLRLPDTRATGSLAYVMASGDILTSLTVDTMAFADVRGAYTPLPSAGGGKMELQAAIRTSSPSEFVARDVRLHAGTAEVNGTLGLTLGDSVTRFDATELRFTRVPTSLIESMVPGVKSPVTAEFSGRARLNGPLTAMQSELDATIAVARTAPFRMSARGEFGVGDYVTAKQLRISGDGIPVALAREFDIESPVGGTVHVEATVSGSSASRFRGIAAVTHSEAGSVSHVTAEGSVTAGRVATMAIDVRIDSVALALAKHWLSDSTDVRGVVTGTARVSGTSRDLATELHLRLPGGGAIDGDVTYKLPDDTIPVLGAALTFGSMNLQAVLPALPRTSLNGSATLDTRGFALATMSAGFSAMLGPSKVDTAEFVEMVVRGGARDGLLDIDTLRVETTFASATANGTFGLTEGKQGTLRFKGEVPDINLLAPWIASGDTGSVAPRPARAVRLERRASRTDSIRMAQLAEQDPAALLAADLQGIEVKRAPRPAGPVALRRDEIAGSIAATGQVQGSIVRAIGTADVQTSGLQVNGSQVGPGMIKATWRHDTTAVDTIDVTGGIQLLQVEGFEFDSTRFRVRHVLGKTGTGDADVSLFVGDSATESSASYRVAAGYTLPTDSQPGEVRVRDLRMRMDTTTWRSAREGVIRWKGSDLAIDSLELRDAADSTHGRILVHGTVPATDPIKLDVAWDSVRIAPFIALLQGDVDADGSASGQLAIEGTRSSPRFKGRIALAQPLYNKSALPLVQATIAYADRSLEVDAEAIRATGGRVARVSGTIPVDLSLTDSLETRFPDKEVALVVEGDSIPLSPLSLLTDQITNVQGRAQGHITVSGTVKKPHLTGDMSMVMDSARIAYTGVGLTNVVARLHMVGDTLVLDTLSGRSGGTISGGGRIVLADLVRPVMKLRLVTSDALVIDDERGKLYAQTQISVDGPLDTLSVGGRITITRGVIKLPEPDTYDVINTNDPAIFAVVDTATARKLGLVTESSTMDNLRLAIDLRVNRGTFARSADANVEIYGEVRIRLDSTTNGKFGLTGQLLTDYGDYRFMSKHFVVKRGSVRFTGGTDLNPLVQVVATYEVPQTARAPLEIRVNVGGTLEKPVISLESDAQPALSNSDLISMLAFGRSTSSLLQASSQSGGGQAGSPLTGNAAALSAQMLGSMAIDAIADKSTDDLTRITRADVVNITPGELPPDLSMGAWETLLKGTEIEVGRYLDRQTFVMARVRTTLVIPGATFERRLSERFRWRATFDTRFLQETPTLSTGIEPRTIQVIGSMFAWSFSW